MARVKKHSSAAYHLYFILWSTVVVILPSTVTASDSAPLCTLPSPVPRNVPGAGKDDKLKLLQSFQLSAGYFVGGEEIHFAEEEDNDEWPYVPRSFSVLPHAVHRTDDGGLLHVAATLTLFGGRTRLLRIRGAGPSRNSSYQDSHHVSFYLDGYYHSNTGELCAFGEGTYSEDDGTIRQLKGVELKLRVPNPSSLLDPFVTGALRGADFKAISLVAYAEGSDHSYQYRQKQQGAAASCAPPPPSTRGAFDAFGGAKFSCARLRERLVSSFRLRNVSGDALAASSTSSPALPWLRAPLMHVAQVRCTPDGAARAYVVLSGNDTAPKRGGRLAARGQRPWFKVKGEAMVAEGRWDAARNMLCLSACRVARSPEPTSPLALAVRRGDCGIGMSFWFPGVWTIRDRSAVAGMLWNSSRPAAGGVSASSIDVGIHRSNFSDVKYSYNYTMVDKAKDHYLASDLSNCDDKKTEGSFIAANANYTYRDFEFSYHHQSMIYGWGDAYPVTIDSVMVYGDRLAADVSFSRHAVANNSDELLSVSYEIRQQVPPAGWAPPKNRSSYSIPIEQHQIAAEGVYDPKTGVLCMIGCREVNSTSDCEVLITVQFAPLDRKKNSQDRGKGAISSLRSKTDRLYFEKIEIGLYGMYTDEIAESVSRMDMESVMLAVSTTLPCVFTVLQILHAKRHPEASAATSVTMLAVVALGYVASLLGSSEALFMSRRAQWLPFQSYMPYELNQAMLRAPTLIALLLQLRLLQLAWSGRESVAVAPDQSKAAGTWSAAERRALWVCLPLYVAGGALTVVANLVNGRRAKDSLTVHVGPGPATLWQDLLASAGLALDGFLLPQVAMNVFAGAGGAGVVRAISSWFYVGGTVVRAAPHIYDVIRRQGYVPSAQPSYVYAGPSDDRFGLAWDIAVPCVTGLLAALLFLQQRRAGAFLPRSRSRRSGGYEMVSSTPI